MEKPDIQLESNLSVWKKFRRNRLAFAGLIFIIAVSVLSILGYLIIPDKSPFANRQSLEIAAKSPGFSVYFFKKPIKKELSKISTINFLLFGKSPQNKGMPITAMKAPLAYGRACP